MAIIKQYSKAAKTWYVYDSHSYWDKEKQQPRSRRKLIGKIDEETGEIVPTGRRGRKPAVQSTPSEKPAAQPDVIPTVSNTDGESVSNFKSLYDDCHRQLAEKEIALSKTRETVTELETELQQLRSNIDQLLLRVSMLSSTIRE